MATGPEPNPYLKTKVMTADPAQLRLMLFDGALKFAEQGRLGLVARDYEAAFNGISRCQQILTELISSLNPQHAPELCQKLAGLYTFMVTRLMAASHQRDPAIVEEVIKLLEYERTTWTMLLEKLARETAAPTDTPTPPAASGAPGSPNDASSLIGGTVSFQG